jgi:hypothetical protein
MQDCPAYSKMGDNGPTNTETLSFSSEQLPAITIKGYASEKGNTIQAMNVWVMWSLSIEQNRDSIVE